MDATTNPEEYFPGIDFPLDPDLSSFMGIGEGCLEVNGLASDPLIADLQSLDLETDASNSPLSQGDNYQNQSFSGYFPPCGLMQEGLQFNAYDSPFDALRPLPIYSGPSYLAPLPQATPRNSLELGNNIAVSIQTRDQSKVPSLMNFFNLVEQPVLEGDILCNATNLRPNTSPSPVPRLSFSPDTEGKDLADDTMEQIHGFRTRADPFPCHLCKDSFASKKSLNRHFVVWHREYARLLGLRVEMFPCPVRGCKRSYTRLDNVKRHVKNKHGNLRP